MAGPGRIAQPGSSNMARKIKPRAFIVGWKQPSLARRSSCPRRTPQEPLRAAGQLPGMCRSARGLASPSGVRRQQKRKGETEIAVQVLVNQGRV
jgi:hypothetical protein